MPTWNDRIQAIMREEREASMTAMENLDLPNEAKWDMPDLWVALQHAVNTEVARIGRTLDGRILPTTLRLMADEHERIWKRMEADGSGGIARATATADSGGTMTMLTVAQVAAQLEVTQPRVIQLIADGTIKATKHGRDWMIDPSRVRRAAKRPGPGWRKGRKRTTTPATSRA